MGRAEGVRKAIHGAASLVAAAVVALLDPVPAAVILAGATTVALAVELARRVSPAAARLFGRLAGLLKDRERVGLTGATTLSMGFTVAAALFPGAPTMFGILVTGLADPAASVVGVRGRLRYPGGKSVAGSAAFLVVALLVALGLGLEPGPAAVTALMLTALEAIGSPIDDNLYLPVAGALALVLTGWTPGP